MKTILINCISAGSGGAITYLKNLIPRLLGKIQECDNVRAYLLLNSNQIEYVKKEIDGLDVVVIVAPSLSGYTRVFWEKIFLKRLIEKHAIDLVFTPYQIAEIFKDKKNIVMLRNMDPFTFHKYPSVFKNWLRNHILNAQTKRTLKSADVVIAVSTYVADFIKEYSLAKETVVHQIYHGRNTYFTPIKKKATKSS